MNQPRTPAEPVTPPGELYAIDDVDRRIIALLRANGRATNQQIARDLFGKVTSGVVGIRIDQRFPLDRVADAHRALEARETTGSTILTLR